MSGFGRPIKRYQRFRSHSEAEVAKDINAAAINYHLKNHVLVVWIENQITCKMEERNQVNCDSN